MANPNSLFAGDPRRGNLFVMAAIAIIVLLLAVIAVWHSSGSNETVKPSELFPGFAARVSHHEPAHIRIESKANGIIDVALNPTGVWVVASRGSYPASFEQVNGTLVGLAAMQIIEPKTSKPDWLHYLGLDGPPKGDGVRLTVSNAKGETLAALIAGKTSDIGDATGATGLFVRKPDGNQSWLVRSVAEIRSAASDWMEKSVMDVDRARIQTVTVTPPQGPAYTVHRDKPATPDFTLTPIPPGREVSDPSAPGGTAEAVVGFSFDDVRPAAGFDFATGATKLVTQTFDGLTVTVTTIHKGDEYWATVAADALPMHGFAFKESRDINTHAKGWAYKLAQYKGAQFTASLESLLKPKGAPAKTTP